MSEQLEPCPFCGGRKSVGWDESAETGGVFIFCNHCMMTGPAADNKDEAITAWNTRKDR